MSAHVTTAQVTASRTIAVTFDDLPGTAYLEPTCMPDRVLERTRNLLHILREHGVPAAGFVNEGHTCRDTSVLEDVLRQWLDDGHTLGNHTFGHTDLNDVSLAAYVADIERGSRLTRRLLAEYDQPLTYFRHPELHAGADSTTWNGLRTWLDERGYSVAPVTIDNQEWIFEAVYRRAKRAGNTDLLARIADAYVPFLSDVMTYFETRSKEVVGREPAQILLLHANDINADHFGRVVDMLRERGYDFVTLAEALRDPAYEMTDGYIGPQGLSWIHRWAWGQHLPMGTDEPREPAWVRQAFESGP